MPTYVVTTHPNRLSTSQKAAIVAKISEIHSVEGGGVPQWLVQVIFNEVPSGNWFINKRLVPTDQIWVRGDIRAGRSEAQKARMCERVMAECAAATDMDKSFWWVYICDADKTAEFGSVLPEPGGEKEWIEGIDKEVRERYGLY